MTRNSKVVEDLVNAAVEKSPRSVDFGNACGKMKTCFGRVSIHDLTLQEGRFSDDPERAVELLRRSGCSSATYLVRLGSGQSPVAGHLKRSLY